MTRRLPGRPWLIALMVIPLSLRRSLGLPWLIALVAIPLLTAVIGYCALDRPRFTDGPTEVVATMSPPIKSGVPRLSLAPLSVVRDGNDIAISGNFADDPAKAALIKGLKGSLHPGVKIVDQTDINPTVRSLDFSNAGPLFNDSASIRDFNLTVNGSTIILAGSAASQEQKAAVEHDAAMTWSGVHVVGSLVVSGPAPSGLPGPILPATCPDLPSAINARWRSAGGQITFLDDGFSLTPADRQTLTRVPDKLEGCPTAHATVNGYNDDAGTEAINIAVSGRRAQKVVDYLLGRGVSGDQLVVKGLGSVNPVAPDDTAAGRAGSRVEIEVS